MFAKIQNKRSFRVLRTVGHINGFSTNVGGWVKRGLESLLLR